MKSGAPEWVSGFQPGVERPIPADFIATPGFVAGDKEAPCGP